MEKDIFFKIFSTIIGMESILTQWNSTEKYLFYCYANFVAKRLLLTKKKQNLNEFNSNVIGYKMTLIFLSESTYCLFQNRSCFVDI